MLGEIGYSVELNFCTNREFPRKYLVFWLITFSKKVECNESN